MTERYFDTGRTEIIPYLPARIERLLDIGCGAGATTKLIRSMHPNLNWAGGVEIVAEQAKRAENILDRVWNINIEQVQFENEIEANSLDLILCLDVLEHLVDPWDVVKRLSKRLRPGGRLLVSVPNIQNWKFVKNLLFKGDFYYRDSGLLDRTHLRFFVKATAESLAQSGGLQHVQSVALPELKAGDARWLIDKIALGATANILAKQWLIVVERPA